MPPQGKEPERRLISPALLPFLEEAKKRGGRLLIAKCQWLLSRRQLAPVEILNVTTREDEYRALYGDPDPEWIECRMLDFDDVERGWKMAPAGDSGLAEIRG